MTTDPVEFRKCARDLKALSAVKEHTNEERGGGRDPGVRRPGAGRGQLPTRSKIFRAAMHVLNFLFNASKLEKSHLATAPAPFSRRQESEEGKRLFQMLGLRTLVRN